MSDPLTPEFKESAEVPEGLRIQTAIDKLADERVTDDFRKLKKRQIRRINSLKSELQSRRKETVEVMARDILDESVKKISPGLRPKDLPSYDRRELEKFALHDAGVKFDQIVQSRIKKAEKGNLRAQNRFLERAASGLSREQFNENSRKR